MITDPQAIKFSNETIRPAADQLAQLYANARTVVDQWNALGISALFPNDSTVVVDGSATDGRHAITGQDATNIIVRLTEFVTDYEANANAKLNTVLKVSVNP